jgi:uncharacterized membrane protein
MDWLVSLDLVIPGFVACAEFGFFVFVRSILRRLPERFQIEAEQAVVRTYGRVMPIFTGISVILILIYALRFTENNTANRAVWFAVFFFSAAVATSIWLNQPIEHEISSWNPEQLPADWKSIRRQWVIAQGLRASLQLAGFVLFCISIGAR